MRSKATKANRILQLWRFIRNWNEFVSIPVGLLLFLLVPHLLRKADSTAATFDLGVLHAPMYGIAVFFLIKGLAWLSLKLDFPKLYKYLDYYFEADFFRKGTKLWVKIVCVFGLFVFYFLSLLVLTVALL